MPFKSILKKTVDTQLLTTIQQLLNHRFSYVIKIQHLTKAFAGHTSNVQKLLDSTSKSPKVSETNNFMETDGLSIIEIEMSLDLVRSKGKPYLTNSNIQKQHIYYRLLKTICYRIILSRKHQQYNVSLKKYFLSKAE